MPPPLPDWDPDPDPQAEPPADGRLTLRLHPHGPTLLAPRDQSLWRTLAEAGIDWPVSCRNGSCRRCIGRLLHGEVHHTVPWPGLLPEEKASGHVLPCVAWPLSCVVLAPAEG
jgi:ferredoxin